MELVLSEKQRAVAKKMSEGCCNRCGKPLDMWDVQENFTIVRNLGYGTKNDGSVLNLHLCCDCLDELVEQCIISPITNHT